MKYGLIGERLGHSFSKQIHEKLASEEYTLCEICDNELEEFLSRRDFSGINVTIPYKERVIPYLDFIDEDARKIGAVNTIVNRDGRLYGYNTDFYGLVRLIKHAGIEVSGKKTAILGSGGTSKTALAVLRELGAGEIIKVSRTKKEGFIDYDEFQNAHTDCQVILNTTPVGMFPEENYSPVDISRFHSLIGVIDVIYNPINTLLIQNARSLNIKAEGGLYMLVAQAVRAAEIFHGKSYPERMADDLFCEIKKQRENIVLIGMPSCGKSSVGRILAERLGKEFIDTDDIITRRIGMSIKDFFSLHGEEEFRKIEAQVIEDVAKRSQIVLATGGGAVLRGENIKILKFNGKLYFLDRKPDKLTPSDSRPLAQNFEQINELYLKRYPIYCQACDEKVNVSGDENSVAEKILENYL